MRWSGRPSCLRKTLSCRAAATTRFHLSFRNLLATPPAYYACTEQVSCTGIEVVLLQNEYPTPRRWARHKVDLPVCVITHGPTNVAAVQGRGSELNCGGMAVCAGVELSIGDQVGVEFTPPDSGQAITVRCFVRNGHGYRYGVEFITENDADYESVGQIESILRNLGSSVSPI